MTMDSHLSIGRLRPTDAAALCRFYNALSAGSIRTFRPLGAETTLEACEEIARDNTPARDVKHDLVAWDADEIIGWCFLWGLDSAEPKFGLGIADRRQGRGLGPVLARRIMSVAAQRDVERVVLTVVKDNLRARRVYEQLGFTAYGEFVSNTDGLPYLRMAIAPGG